MLKNRENLTVSNIIYFIVVATGAFAVTFSVFYFLGVVPAAFKSINPDSDVITEGSPYNPVEGETRPDRITIDKVGVDSFIGQPNTQNVGALDQFLTKGAVYYPGSGTIESGNMFLFGHSTGLAIVRNQAYKTFNGIEKLLKGDEIKIEADGVVYIYKVTSVKLSNENDALVRFDSSKRSMTLSTCNSFGAKQERWIVEAEFDREV